MDGFEFDVDAIVKCLDYSESAADVGTMLDCACCYEDIIVNVIAYANERGSAAEKMLDGYDRVRRLALRALSSQANVHGVFVNPASRR